MIECRDLALNHPLKVGGSWDSFEPNGTVAHISAITPTLLGIAHIGVGGHYLSTKVCHKQNIKKISINVKKDSARCHVKECEGLGKRYFFSTYLDDRGEDILTTWDR